jgi:hypothetical protein
MDPEKIQLPEAVLTTNRLGFRRRGRRFTTDAHETRLCQEKEVREAAWAVRCARIATIEKDAELDIGLKKAGKVLQLIDSLLRELAIRQKLDLDRRKQRFKRGKPAQAGIGLKHV